MPPKKTKPNETCPCGSGKKHKKCCMVAGNTLASSVAAAASSAAAATTVLDEVMEAFALTTTAAASTTPSDRGPCFHGSTSDRFRDGVAYRDVIRDYLSAPDRPKFIKDHQYFTDLTFSRYVFAVCTSWYLAMNRTTVDMRWLLQMAIEIKYLFVPAMVGSGGPALDQDKLNRYCRGIHTTVNDRGVINCLSRETKPFCDCMKVKKTEADGLEKTEFCWRCRHSFPRDGMLKCSGCKIVMYCNEDCQTKDWPRHRETCKTLEKVHRNGFCNLTNEKEQTE